MCRVPAKKPKSEKAEIGQKIPTNNNDGKHMKKLKPNLTELIGALIPLVLYQMFHPGHFQGLL
jgi:hypothetical protein